jgi:hypothetical protein
MHACWPQPTRGAVTERFVTRSCRRHAGISRPSRNRARKWTSAPRCLRACRALRVPLKTLKAFSQCASSMRLAPPRRWAYVLAMLALKLRSAAPKVLSPTGRCSAVSPQQPHRTRTQPQRPLRVARGACPNAPSHCTAATPPLGTHQHPCPPRVQRSEAPPTAGRADSSTSSTLSASACAHCENTGPLPLPPPLCACPQPSVRAYVSMHAYVPSACGRVGEFKVTFASILKFEWLTNPLSAYRNYKGTHRGASA